MGERLACPYPGARLHSGESPYTPSRSPTETENSQTPLQSVSSHTDYLDAPKAQCPVFTQEVDPLLIKTSLEDRVAYLTDFLDFTSRDAEVISKIAPKVNEVIPGLVDGMYAKLFEFDITKKVFMNRNQGFDGPLPTTLEDLTLDSAQIVFRKVFMKAWARRVLTADYTSGKTWAYMDKVGVMHTGASPFKHQRTMGIAPLNVPCKYRDIAMTLGWIQSILHKAILQLPESTCPASEKIEAVTAINKVLWIQNDLFSRHYIGE
ncbi:Protoglobin-domain-containing protein [Epithele typhae]|uniref:Protoglobin-domain-containing protein n=1 Tax=Epithele typhae TaxID=378194 RepID=UPI0020087CC3|nr:Protoglobin-domain-containing protein [Epithele typhae]KAH9927176.1 Protoglobin-domain-containing protein [Epithele typhae]